MPKYKVNGKIYNIPDDKVAGFEKKYPEATVEFYNEGKKYNIPIDKREGFLKQFPDATTFAPKMEQQPASQTTQQTAVEPMKSDTIQPVQPIQSPNAKIVNDPDDYFPKLAENTRNDVARLTEEVDESLNEAKGQSVRQYAEQAKQAAKGGFWKSVQNALMNTAGAASPTDMQVQTQQQVWRGGQDQELAKDIDNYEAAETALENARRTINEADINAKNGTLVEKARSTFVGGTVRGFGQKLFDVRTWDMGTTNLRDQLALNQALDAAENGTLTESQQTLLDAKAQEMATQAYFGSYVGRGYKAGSVTAESLPFMLEMCINPASTFGKSAASRLARYAINKYGKKAAASVGQKAIRATARVMGDVAGAATMTATTGAVRTAADAMERMSGGVTFDTDEQGHAVFAGRYETPEDFGTAIRKAFAATTIENGSELLGAYFAPLLGIAGKGIRSMLDKVTAGRVGQFLDNVAASDFAKAVSAFERSAQWSGNLGEFAEEIAGGILNAIIVGDQTLDSNPETGVFSRDNLIDTYLGVNLMGGSLSMLKTVGYGVEKYQLRRDMKRADVAAVDAFGSLDAWEKIKTDVTAASNEELPLLLGNIISDPSITDDQKTALMTYVGVMQREKGVVIGEQKRRENPNVPQEQVEIEQSYDNGRSLETPQEKNDAQNMYEYQQQQVWEFFGLGEDGDVDSYLGDDVTSAVQRVGIGDPKAEQLIVDYFNAKATRDGVIEKAQGDIEDRVIESNAAIDRRTNTDNGTVQAVEMNNGKRAYVIKGNVVTTEDGTMVDRQKSDESIVIADAETGKREMTTPANITNVDQPIDAATEKEAARDQISNEVADVVMNEMNGVLPFNVGDTYTLTDDAGVQHSAQIVADNGDGTVAMIYDNEQEPTVATKDMVQEMFDTTNQLRLGQYLQEKQAQEIAFAEQEAQTEQPEVVAEEQTPIEETPQSAMSRIPTNEAGEQLFEQAPVQDTWAALVELNEGDTAEAVDTAQQMYDNAKKELEKAQKQKPKVGTSVAEIQANKTEHKAKVSAAQAKADYWSQVANFEAEQKRLQEALAAAQRKEQARQAAQVLDKKGRYSEELAKLGDCLDFEDYVMRAIVSGGIKFKWSDNPNGTKGLGSHLGLKGAQSEMARRIWLLNNEEGEYPEIAAQRLLTTYNEDMGFEATRMDAMGALDVILGVLGSYDTPSVLLQAIQDRHNNSQEQYDETDVEQIQAYKAAQMAGMTVEEWLLYEESLKETVYPALEAVSDEELNRIFAETYQEQDERSRENAPIQQGVSERERRIEGNADGNAVLSEQQPDNAETSERGDERSQQADVAGQQSSGDLSSTPVSTARAQLSSEQVDAFIASMEANAVVAPTLELSPENWEAEFGANGVVATPIGTVKMGDNQYLKLLQRKRQDYFGLIKPTLTSPDVILEEYDPKEDVERDTKLLFVKTFIKQDGSRYIHFESVTVRKEDREVSISSHEVNASDLKKKMHNDKVVHLNDLLLDSELRLTEPQTDEGSDLVPTPSISESKDTTTEPITQEVEQENLQSAPENVSEEQAETSQQYTITPAQYTNKRGKVLDMHLVKFSEDLSKEQQQAAKQFAKENRGWWDKEKGGFMMRSEESAKELADTILNNAVAVSDAQPVSLEQMREVGSATNDVADEQPTSQNDDWRYELTVYENGRTILERSQIMPNGTPVYDGHFEVTADSPREMQGILSNPANGLEGVLDQIGAKLNQRADVFDFRAKARTEGVNGFKIGDKVVYTYNNKSEQGTIHDFNDYGDHAPVLDLGAAPILYVQAQWDQVKKITEEPATQLESKGSNANPSGNKLVTDERYEELKRKMRQKLMGQMNVGIDPEILAIGTEMALYHIEKGARKFADYAKDMIADLGDIIRPYLKAFYNGARELPEVEKEGFANEMTPYDEVRTFDVANFDKAAPNAMAAAETTVKEQEVEQQAEVATEKIKNNRNKARKSAKKSVTSQQDQLDIFNYGTEEDTRTDNSGAESGREELSETQSVGPRTPVQNLAGNSESERVRLGDGSSKSRNGSQYDVNKNYSNEEIGKIVSSVTDVVDGKVVITGVVTDDIKAICRQYKSGGVAKKGRGILDEYYTDGKIVDAVNMLIAPYFKNASAIRVLEPSVGVGNFIEATRGIPVSDIQTFEINETTARIAKILYPNVDVNLRSFETEFIDETGKKKPLPQKFNLVIGNPPYGSHRGLYKGLGEESRIARYEDYFVKRSLDVLQDGGMLAMVLPSSWIDRHSTFGGYAIEVAYRLPSGAFESTQIGTDIVVLRKDTSIPTTAHTSYFEQHPERILGEVKQRKGRYGKIEDYVEGDIDVAIAAIERDHAKQLAKQLDIEGTNDNLNDIQTAIEETGGAEKAKAIVESEKTRAAENESTRKTGSKQGKYKVKLNRGAETVPTSLQFTHEFSEGEIDAFEDTNYDGVIAHPAEYSKYVNYFAGKPIHDFYYAEGDIYSKLSQLEADKSVIIQKYGIEQYEKQKRLLENVLPKRKELAEITISPNTTFVKNLNITTEAGIFSLADLFVDFCRKLPYQAFGNSSSWEVISYVHNEQVYGQDKQRNQLIRERRKKVANELFGKFLNEELSDSAKNRVVMAFNREYNSVYKPDYSKVPMFSTINRDFKGKNLKLTSVQLAGIGRMTVKGVGVLAHEVGFGKTLSGVLAMHEAMTRGFAEKPLIVVPNDNILKQWVETIKEALPNATVNMLGNLGTSYDLTDFKVNAGEFTIVTYEGLKAMSFSDETYNRLAERFSYITEDLKKHQSERDVQKNIEKKQELKGKMRRGVKTAYGFEDFGFDWLTFDEVHNANHIVSKVRLDKSVASDFRSQSQRTSDLGLKTWLAAQYIQEKNNGRNVLLLSATPFTNKPLEYYSILSLVANDMLKRKGFFNVDQFFTTFMEADNDLEIAANGRPVQKTNVRRFRNNGLFQQLLSEFIDIKGEEDNPELVRPERRNKEYKVAQNDLTAEAMTEIQGLLNDNDTVLQGITHARAAAFSPYATLLLGQQPKNYREFVKNSPKIDATIKLIEQNKKDRPDAGQIIYSEVGVEFFPLIRDYLIKESGFKPNEVRIITGATSNNERVNIQTAFNDGEVKVVIGSPAIKEGLNLQENTTDMYILSLPWNFTQLRQIEGRGWRQGNKWMNIRINHMLTNDSIDVFMLQRLQLKQGLYNEAMKSGAESLDVGDIDTAELKTVLITDPSVRAEIVVKQERDKLEQDKTQVEADLSFVMRKYESYNKLIEKLSSQKNVVNYYKKYAVGDSAFWGDRVKREELALRNIEKDIEQEKENLAKKGVNVDDITRQTEQAQNTIASIQEKIDNLKEYQQELTEKYRKEEEAKANEQGDSISSYIKERKEENAGGFYKMRPQKGEQQAKAEDDDIRFRAGDIAVPRLTRYTTEKHFGGIWIEDKQEFAKFASAVNNYAFEEDGEGIAYTDNYFYAYYINIDGDVIPYASVYLNAKDSQDVVTQVNQEVKNGRKEKGIKGYIDRAVVRARSTKGENNAYNGNYSSSSDRRGYDRLGRNIFRKGRYYDNPSFFVKAQRTDKFGLISNREGGGVRTNDETVVEQMVQRADALAAQLHLDDVEIVTDPTTLPSNRRTQKGFYSISTGKITIVVPNHASVYDVEQTVLHEAVAHHGLRELFGADFDTFLDNVYQNVNEPIRRVITNLAARKGWEFREATEEYLASLAETTNFEEIEKQSWWQKVKDFFMDLLRKVGVKLAQPLTNNELRYILWRSYQMQVSKGAMAVAEDVDMQRKLGVGNFRTQQASVEQINAEFNKQLDSLTEENAREVILNVGMPSSLLRDYGVEDKPIRLYGAKLLSKIRKHGYQLNDVKNLPLALRSPIAIFRGSEVGSFAILTELRIGDNNVLVTLSVGKGGHDVDFNIISSVYDKRGDSVARWINNEKLLYVNKEKALDYLSVSAPIAEAQNNQELDSATKIVEEFDNAKYRVSKNAPFNRDREYLDAVDRGDMVEAQRMIDEAAKKAGYTEKVYHGTQFFGFTKFGSQRPSGAIFTSDKRNVAANYGGGNRYAPVRRINQGYKGGRTSEEVISDARSVYDQEWRMVNDEERSVLIDKIEADAKRVMQKMNSLQIDVPTEIRENVAWIENIIYSAAEGRENGNEGDEMQRMLLDDYEKFVENRNVLREWLGDHRSELTMQQQQYLDYLIGYEVLDVAVDAGHSFANAFGSDEITTVDGLHFVPIRKLWEETRKVANVGSYELYGNLGNRPLIINGEGKAWYGLDFNGMRSTDDIVEWAKQEGYTSVVFNNISDNGDPSDVKVFFNPEQVKSADPVTYDDNGNVIPLSQRFNSTETDIRFRSSFDRPAAGIARDIYNEKVRTPKTDAKRWSKEYWSVNTAHRLHEAYIDSMAGLKTLQEAILEETGNEIHSYEDAYKAENRMSASNKSQSEIYMRDFFQPLMDEVGKLAVRGATLDDIKMYLIAKHGLERNIVFAHRNAQREVDERVKILEKILLKPSLTARQIKSLNKRINIVKAMYDGIKKNLSPVDAAKWWNSRINTLNTLLSNGKITPEQYDKRRARLDTIYNEGFVGVHTRDYSGLTDLTGEDKDFQAAAQHLVQDFEAGYNTKPLWDKINAATKESLRINYDSGLMSKETYDKVRTMFAYYVPLRGWDRNVAADEYEYLTSNRPMLSPTLKTAKGRKSLADDPIATIGYMAESAIIQGNRNLMKQKFLNFVLNNPTSLATVSEQWYVRFGDEWVPSTPNIPADATADEVDAIVKEHNQRMEDLGDEATKIREGLKIGKHTTAREGQEHVIRVKRAGKEYCIYINGNPIAAQAINGLTNPNTDQNAFEDAAQWLKNLMARAFTSQNPAFIFTNLSRDVIWAGTAVAVKENKAYAIQYAKNVTKILGTFKLPVLLRKFQNGTLDMNNEVERYFAEFIRNGGETGFTQINTVEDYKRDIQRMVNDAKGKTSGLKKAWQATWEGVEFLNRSAEDITRFSVYITSRQMGRDIANSIWNAKEVTVNFNKKGRGTFGASLMNFAYIFFNASIQGLANFGRLMYRHPKKMTLALSTFAAAGMIAPMYSIFLSALWGDDDDNYWDLPEWVRRNNIVLYNPFSDRGFFTIPLPHELRPFYGMGELFISVIMGKENIEDALSKVARGFADLLPIDVTGNGGNMAINLTPTIAQPTAQLIANTDYFGVPIYRKNDYNELNPEWTKAYKGTNPFLVESAKWLNDVTGGDNVVKGKVDINPATVEHLFESYLGGMGKTFNKTVTTLSMLFNKDAREWRNVPVLSSFYQVPNDRTSGSQVNREYFEARDEADKVAHQYSGYKKQLRMGAMEYAEKLDELIKSPIFARYQVVNGYNKAITKLNTALKQTTDPTDSEQIETAIMELKAEMLAELEKLDAQTNSNASK